jgi:PAS domain S-box-containing protein
LGRHHLGQIVSQPGDEEANSQRLTAREQQCVGLLAEGLGAGEIAFRLGLKKVTVDLHIRNAKRKLRSRTREQAVAIAIRQAEEKYRKVFNSATDAMFIFDEKGTILDANGAAAELYGYSLAELVDRKLHIGRLVAAAGEFALDATRVDSTERKRSGEPFIAEVSFSSFQHGGNTQNLAVVRDVTRTRAAKQALREVNARLTAVLDSTEDGIFMKDRQFRFTHVNRAMLEFNEARLEDMLGRTDDDFIRPEEIETIRASDRAVLAGQTVRAEYSVTVAGRLREVEVVKVPVRDDEGNVIGICGVSREIGQRKMEKTRLQLRTETLMALLDNLPEAVTLKDADGRMIFCNRQYRRHHGLKDNEHVGRAVHEIYPPHVADEIKAQEQIVVRSRRPKLFSVERPHPEEGTRRLIVLRFPILTASGDIVGIGSMSLDTSDLTGVSTTT